MYSFFHCLIFVEGKKIFFTLRDLIIQHGLKKFFSITTLKAATCLSKFLLIVKTVLN